jgi:uncharacterized phage protein gp47/JayE
VIGQGEEPGVQIDTNDLMHVELQPHLNEPPRAVDACYPLAGIHLGNSLMKHMVYAAQEEFSQREAVATSQMSRHCDVVQGGLVGFATENKSAQPHIQKGSVFNITKGIVFHMLQDVILVSVPWLYPCLA